MMKNAKCVKYCIMPLVVALITCTCENQVLVTIDSDQYKIADFKENFQFSPTDDSLMRLEKVDGFINQMLIVKEGQKRGYDNDPVVKAALETHRMEIVSRGYYEANVINRIKVSDSEVRKVYNQSIDQYHLAQIVVAEESLAQYLQAELHRGQPFESLLKFSLDTLSENGDIGLFSASKLPSEILVQVKKIKEGGTTSAIKFGNYYHIFRLIEHKKADTPGFAEVKTQIRNDLMQKKIIEVGGKFIQDILEEAKVEYNQEGLDVLIKPDSLITGEDLDKWVVKKYDTAYVYVRTIREGVLHQYSRSRIDPARLIERILIPELIYDKAMKEYFDKNVKVQRRLHNALSLLIYQKFYSDEVIEKVVVDSMDVVNYFKEHKNDYEDKKLNDVYLMVKARVREEKIIFLREELFENLRAKYNPQINQEVLNKLLKEER